MFESLWPGCFFAWISEFFLKIKSIKNVKKAMERPVKIKVTLTLGRNSAIVKNKTDESEAIEKITRGERALAAL